MYGLVERSLHTLTFIVWPVSGTLVAQGCVSGRQAYRCWQACCLMCSCFRTLLHTQHTSHSRVVERAAGVLQVRIGLRGVVSWTLHQEQEACRMISFGQLDTGRSQQSQPVRLGRRPDRDLSSCEVERCAILKDVELRERDPGGDIVLWIVYRVCASSRKEPTAGKLLTACCASQKDQGEREQYTATRPKHTASRQTRLAAL